MDEGLALSTLPRAVVFVFLSHLADSQTVLSIPLVNRDLLSIDHALTLVSGIRCRDVNKPAPWLLWSSAPGMVTEDHKLSMA